MDIFDFQAQKVVNTEGVFEVYKEDENDLGGLFVRLKNLMISETHTQWDIVYLETYIKKKKKFNGPKKSKMADFSTKG